jgi:hypothetical protein
VATFALLKSYQNPTPSGNNAFNRWFSVQCGPLHNHKLPFPGINTSELQPPEQSPHTPILDHHDSSWRIVVCSINFYSNDEQSMYAIGLTSTIQKLHLRLLYSSVVGVRIGRRQQLRLSMLSSWLLDLLRIGGENRQRSFHLSGCRNSFVWQWKRK